LVEPASTMTALSRGTHATRRPAQAANDRAETRRTARLTKTSNRVAHENAAVQLSHGAARCLVRTPLGKDLLIASNGEAIVESAFVARRHASQSKPTDVLLVEARAQVQAYFARRLRRFDLPFFLEGTPLALAAWHAVASLCFGEFVSYADVARAIGRPGAHRGVASAMGATPLALFIPAHRVIGADGRIKGTDRKSVRARLAAFEQGDSRRSLPIGRILERLF
jgi:O-6-methylguanine DNA methyltransferase